MPRCFHEDLNLYYFERFYDVSIINSNTPRKLVEIHLPLPCTRYADSVG